MSSSLVLHRLLCSGAGLQHLQDLDTEGLSIAPAAVEDPWGGGRGQATVGAETL